MFRIIIIRRFRRFAQIFGGREISRGDAEGTEINMLDYIGGVRIVWVQD